MTRRLGLCSRRSAIDLNRSPLVHSANSKYQTPDYGMGQMYHAPSQGIFVSSNCRTMEML